MKKIFLLAFLALSMVRALAQPSTAAPTPTAGSAYVMSLLGNNYTQISQASGTGTWYPNWGQQTQVAYSTIGGDTTIEYSNLNYQGVQFNSDINAATMDSIHLDIWSGNCTSLLIGLIKTTGGTVRQDVTVPLTTGAWNYVSIPLTSYNTVDLSKIGQMIFVAGTPGAGAVIYLQNVFFVNAVGKPTLGAFSIPTQTLGSGNYTITDPTTNSTGAFTYTSSNSAVATVSGHTVTIVGVGTTTITATEAPDANYLGTTVSTPQVVDYAGPSAAAPAPTAASAYTLSLFGSHYTQLAQATTTGVWYPNWGQSTQVNFMKIGGDTAIEYSNLNYEGVQLNSDVDASTMDSIHFDIWSPNCTSLTIGLIKTTGGTVRQDVTVSLTTGGWNYISIPLSSYNNVDLSKIGQIILVAATPTSGAVVYIQNAYFINAVGKPTFGSFTIPAKNVGDAAFTITPPSTTSTGAFSYTSSNTAVATISGTTVTIHGAGSTTITATEAADANYLTATISATLVVTYADPTTAASTPTKLSSNVISLFGGTYTNVSGITFNPNWGQSTQQSTITVAGVTTLKYNNFNYQGVQLTGNLDVSTMENLHLDVYTPNCTAFDVYLINSNSTGAEKNVTLTPNNTGWNSFDIPLSQYTGIDLTKIGQLKLVATPSGSTVYIENIYFWKAVAVLSITNFTVPTGKVAGDAPFTLTAPTTNSAGAFTYTSSNTSVATISGSTVTIKGAGTTTITATEAADGDYGSGSITALLTVSYPTITAAPTPTKLAANVMSLYSDSYTNVSGINWFPNWGQSTVVSDTTISGNHTKEYKSFNYEGTDFGSTGLNLDAYGYLHIDIWSASASAIDLFLINNNTTGLEKSVTLNLTAIGWNSFDIDLTQYYNQGINLTNIGQFKIQPNPFVAVQSVYLNNIYFWHAANVPTLTNFSIPNKVMGNAPFTITPPTSNSTGAFNYTSSNTSVATVSGSTITIVGVGTTTITATQDATTSYASASKTTTFTVGYAPPAVAASTPTKSPLNVLSVFSDTYSNISGTDFFPNWGQTTVVSTYTIGGNAALKYSNFNYEGTQFASLVDASGMNYLHLDIWTPNCTAFDAYLINTTTSVEQKVTVTPTASGWNSFDIALSQYTNIDLTNIGQFKFVSTPSGSTVYLDNIYFWYAGTIWDGTTWSNGTPSSTQDAIIAGNLTNSTALSTKSLTIKAGVTVTNTGGISVAGTSFVDNGTIAGSGTTTLSGSAAQTASGNGLVCNLTLSNSHGVTISSGSNNLGVTGLLTLQSGLLTTNGNLTLKSTSITNTAVVAPIGTGGNSGTISGTVTVERTIPAGERTYRDLGPEVSNAGSVFANWQEGGVNNNGYGIQITGSKGTTVGYDATTGFDYSLTGNHSMFTYLNNTWDSVRTTKGTTLNPYQGYRVLVRGNRTGSLQTQFTYSTGATLRAKGNLVTGTVTFSNLTSGVGSYSLVANPYVSPVSWNSVVAASTGINGSFWYNDPTFTVDGYATFVSYNTTNGISNPMSQSLMDGYLQPGQGFFVENTTSSPSLVFTEACKVPAQGKTAIFGTSTINRLAVGLYRNGTNVDGAVTAFGSNNAATIGKEDAIKFSNVTENIAFTVVNKDLCINGTTMPSATDVLSIHLYNLKATTNYTLRLDASQFDGNGMQAFIKDNVSKTETLLSGNNTSVSFTTIATDAGSYAGRYSIVFGAGTLPISSIKLTATAQASSVVIKWNTIGESNVANYKVQRSTNGVTFTDIATQTAANLSTASYSINDSKAVTGTTYYRIKVTSNNVSVNYSSVATVTIGKVAAGISAYPNPLVGQHLNVAFNNLETGNYDVAIFNMVGNKVFAKSITHNTNTSVEQLTINNHLAAGTYTVHVTNANGVACQSQIEVE